MTSLAADSRPPNEKPTAYRGAAAFIGGAIVVLLCSFGAIDLLVESGTKDLIAAAILAFVAVLAWLFGVYPAAFSWSDRLVVRNPFRTIDLPWDVVTDLTARLSFVAHTESRRFTVWAIPVSLRERRRADRHKVREMSQAQRAARRGLSADMFGSSASRRPADPIAQLSFADQAISEMNSKREAYLMKARLAAKAAEAAQNEATGEGTQIESAEEAAGEATAANAGTVRWTWVSIALLAAGVAFLIVALSLR